ncbi:MAG: hybrid sensor histidine kinase/response regulator [Gemmatimonadota bacterium]
MSIDDFSLAELFRVEAQSQVAKLTDGLIALEDGITAEHLEELMRAAHSLKGAARIVGHDSAVRLAHELEECFVGAQEGRIELTRERVDVLLQAVDALSAASQMEPGAAENPKTQAAISSVIASLKSVGAPAPVVEALPPPPAPRKSTARSRETMQILEIGELPASAAIDNTERLLSLAGEALVASRVLLSHTGNDTRARRSDRTVERALDELRSALSQHQGNEDALRALGSLHRTILDSVALRREHASELDSIGQRVSDIVSHVYEGVLDARMRPFGEGVAGMPRMLRDTARELGKDARVVLVGDATPVDREVLRRLEAPLGHLIRNAVDHGIETPVQRERWGKPARGTVRVEARHAGGRLLVSVEDDGKGVDLEAVRERVVQRGLAERHAAAEMSALELTHFLFLPGFTLRDEVTAISGRGVGLDAVFTAVREIGGDVRIIPVPTGGTRFELQLPLTLSVVRALVVEVAGETYSFPLARVHRLLRVARDEIESIEGRQHFALDNQQVGLIWAHQLLGRATPGLEEIVSVVVVGEQDSLLGIVVDRFIGEQELVLRGMDSRLGKVQDVGGAALLPDGAPTLVLDVDDLLRSAANLVAGGRLDPMRAEPATHSGARKRVLVVDDSLTVRELERKMIEAKGYAVDVAVDGMDAWNAVRTGHYDLVVTDVDMPRMDGIELVTRIKGDPQLRNTPVMIVSYKDRDEDRRRGLDAGADYYLTKGSFYDETMLRAIEDFIGSAT